MPQIDVHSLSSDSALVIREERPKELEARLTRELAEEEHRRWKDKWLFIGSSSTGLLVLGISLCLVLWSTDPDTKKWAQSVVTALVAGIIGYLAGKK